MNEPNASGPTLLPRGPAALPPDAVARAHRERLLRAMADAVAEKGYVATSIADIVSRARVSRSAFYACFRDKEDCFLAGYAAEADRHFELITDAVAAQPEWLDQLTAGAHAYVRQLRLQPRFARTFLVEVIAAGPRATELRAEVHDRYAGLMKTWYDGAPKSLRLPPLPDEIFRAAVGATNELVIARLERVLERDAEALEEAQPLERLVRYTLFAIFGLTDVAGTDEEGSAAPG